MTKEQMIANVKNRLVSSEPFDLSGEIGLCPECSKCYAVKDGETFIDLNDHDFDVIASSILGNAIDYCAVCDIS